jgi:deoxyribodipyrimidine photolyase-related protein
MADDENPAGGQWNYDKQNRKPLPSNVEPPAIPRFPPDEITSTVMEEIEHLGIGFGALEGFDLAVDREQAQQAFQDFLQHRLRDFGPYEDAMSSEHTTLYHSVLSPYINLGLLEPLPLAQAVEAAYHAGDAPINSVEGFIRQIVGWREFMYWQYWRSMPEILDENAWQARRPLPEWFWDAQTEMHCLHQVLGRVIEDGYVHHIERLMVICNFALLAEIEPKSVNDWFTSTFVDAYEWVMAPNVLGMGLNADGGIIATKPYIASANYINKMSDYCRSCRYNHKARSGADACPFNTLYWRFLIKHEPKLRADPRLGRNVLGLRHLSEDERRQVTAQGDSLVADP